MLSYLQRNPAGGTDFIVGGEPFIALAGQRHDSSPSSKEYMDTLWPKLAALNLNAVAAAVTWEATEPQEGRFNFSRIKYLIDRAEEHSLKLILLWFGSWKNGASSYVPEWVKTDVERFFRAENRDGIRQGSISPLCGEAMKADARAFKGVMSFISEYDGNNTVIAVQIEDNIGLSGCDRDYCEAAESSYASGLYSKLRHYLCEEEMRFELGKNAVCADGSRSYAEVFGDDAAEAFMAWYYSRYVGFIAAAGKEKRPIPMFVNCRAIRSGGPEGEYPSGNPVPKVMDIWSCGAPEIDFSAVDLNRKELSAEECEGSPLFLTGLRGGVFAPAYALYAVGEIGAVCVSPFGIDEIAEASVYLAAVYRILNGMTPLICGKRLCGGVRGVMPRGGEPPVTLRFEKYTAIFTPADCPAAPVYPPGGIIAESSADEFFIAGLNIKVEFTANEKGVNTEFILVEEGRFSGGEWKPGKRLDGDGLSLNFNCAPELRRVRLFNYPSKSKHRT